MAHRERAQLLTPPGLTQVRRPLPKSWLKAAGLLRNKKKALANHLKMVRGEWSHTRKIR